MECNVMAESSDIRQLADSAEVVVFHSPVTDLAGLDALLERSGRDWRMIEMGMGSAESRGQFATLKAQTGWPTLPQVFVHGQFVGGLSAAEAKLQPASRYPTAAAWMGYLGLLPFFLAGLGLWLGPTWLAGWLLAYGAVILAFVGAIHWGLAMSADGLLAEPFYASVLPALVGWVALLMPPLIGLPVLIAGFIAWRVWEHRAAPVVLPSWFRRLRSVLTVGAVLGLSAGWIALLPFTGTG
jgi:glutaredoxin